MKTTFIAGPCVIESQELLYAVAEKLVEINQKLEVDIIFKASFDKANRTSISSFRGPGLERGLDMLANVKSKYGLKLLTDIHESYQAEVVGQVVDLVVDFRNIPDMKEIVPTVIMDCTHSVQRPGAMGGKTGGDRRFVPSMALAAKAFGATGYFFEVHPNPDKGLSDGPNMLELDKLENLIANLL